MVELKTPEEYMKEAIKEAKKAYKKDEVPVGAIIVKNRRNNSKSTQSKRNKKGYNKTCRDNSNTKGK